MTDTEKEIHNSNREVYCSYTANYSDELIYSKSAIEQCYFMLYKIYPALKQFVRWQDYNYHTSKSCKLPVYSAECSWGKFYFRDNFYDVILSVELTNPMSEKLAKALSSYTDVVPSWAEGMGEVVYPLPKIGEKNFSIYLSNNYGLYAVLHLITVLTELGE